MKCKCNISNLKFKKMPEILGILVAFCILYYLKYLNNIGCVCALNDKRTYILYYTCLIILFNIFAITPYYSLKFFTDYRFITYFLVLGSVLNIIFTLQYIDELKKNNCECSKSIIRDIMFILATIRIFIWLLLLLLCISLFINYNIMYN